jgi:hypothetical protein
MRLAAYLICPTRQKRKSVSLPLDDMPQDVHFDHGSDLLLLISR